MLSRVCLAALLLLLLQMAPAPGAAAEERSKDAAAATAITIYSDLSMSSSEAQGRALVHQRRQVELPQGEGRIDLADVPASLEPSSVLLRPANAAGGGFTMVEQFMQSVAKDPDSVLRQYLGQDVLINRTQPATGQQPQQTRITETINAKLLAFDDKVIVLQTNNRQLPIQIIARGPDVSEIKLMRAAHMPATRPTLSAHVISEKAGARDVDLIYETRGVAWDASYTLLLVGDGSAGSLEAWANVVNRCGADFADATVRLVADDDRSQHYPVPRRVTLPAAGARRVALLEGSRRVNVSRANVLAAHLGNEIAECLSVANTQDNQLGVAVPPGRMRVMRGPDDNGAPATVLADSKVSSTSVGGAMVIRLGRADGLVATREVGDTHETIDGARHVVRLTKMTLANRRKENARVFVMERLAEGARTMIQHSQPYESGPAADTISFVLELPPGASKTLSYAVVADGG